MAKVLLYSTSLDDPTVLPLHQDAYHAFLHSAQISSFPQHTLTTDPREADLIIFCEVAGQGLFAEAVRHHAFYKQFRQKCFIFDPGDYSLPLLPGLYASLEKKHFDPARTRTGYYLRAEENPYLDFHPWQTPTHLASFRGSFYTHPLRPALAHLPPAQFLIEDTSALSIAMQSWSAEESRDQYYAGYVRSIAQCAFSLCPRGRGAGSMRLFESMRIGRCPVILSDDWIYPARVDWSSCSITVAEKDLPRLPEILHHHLPRAAELGLNARRQWELYYAPNVCFHWLVEDCLELLHSRRHSEPRSKIWLNLLNPITFRRYLTSKKDMLRRYKRLLL